MTCQVLRFSNSQLSWQCSGVKWCPAEVPSRLGKVGSRTCSEFRGISVCVDLGGNRRPFVPCMICVHFNRFPRDPDRTSYITPRRLPSGHVCMSRSAAITEESYPAQIQGNGQSVSPTHVHHFTCTISLNLFPVSSSSSSSQSTFFSFHIFGGLQHPLGLLLQVLPRLPSRFPSKTRKRRISSFTFSG